MRRLLLQVLCAAAVLPAGCGRRDPADASGTRKEILLYCGAGIRPAASAMIEAFEKDHDVRVSANYAGSGQQLGQISVIGKGDLFMPGAELYVDLAVDKGLAHAETKRIVAYFVPVIFVAKGNPKGIRTLRDLGREGLRIGFGDERSCAVGRKTLKILEKNGIPYEEIAKNVVYRSGTVNELGLAVQLGNVDAVILWDANARHFAAAGTIVPIPTEQNVISPIPVAVLKSSKHPEEARAFIDFVTSEKGRAILEAKGYTVKLTETGEASEAPARAGRDR